MNNTRYRVVIDYQGGEFAMGRDYTIEQWRKQAIEWCFMDENDELAEYMYMLKPERVLDQIAELWAVKFRKVRADKKHFDKYSLTDFEDETLEQFYKTRFEGEE